jgi:hypothetical protein
LPCLCLVACCLCLVTCTLCFLTSAPFLLISRDDLTRLSNDCKQSFTCNFPPCHYLCEVKCHLYSFPVPS